MRKLAILGLLGLAACNESAGWNPNYVMSSGPYGEYLRARENALTGQGQAPKVIPVQLPAEAPTPDVIAGGQPRAAAAPVQRQVAARNPDLARFAQGERHEPGTAVYPRNAPSAATAERACRSYRDAAAAQAAFLSAGGPIVDAHGMDPDGDGFVCGWDPRPYRQQQG